MPIEMTTWPTSPASATLTTSHGPSDTATKPTKDVRRRSQMARIQSHIPRMVWQHCAMPGSTSPLPSTCCRLLALRRVLPLIISSLKVRERTCHLICTKAQLCHSGYPPPRVPAFEDISTAFTVSSHPSPMNFGVSSWHKSTASIKTAKPTAAAIATNSPPKTQTPP